MTVDHGWLNVGELLIVGDGQQQFPVIQDVGVLGDRDTLNDRDLDLVVPHVVRYWDTNVLDGYIGYTTLVNHD